MCVLCFGVWCLWCVVQCVACVGGGVWCVVCVGVVSVVWWRGLARGKPRVYVQNASVCTCNTRTCRNTCARVAGTHGSVLNVHTGGFTLSFLSLLSSFLFLRSRPSYFSRSLSLFSLVFPLSNDDNGHSSSVHTALTCLSVKVPVLWLIPCLAEHVRIMHETTVLA